MQNNAIESASIGKNGVSFKGANAADNCKDLYKYVIGGAVVISVAGLAAKIIYDNVQSSSKKEVDDNKCRNRIAEINAKAEVQKDVIAAKADAKIKVDAAKSYNKKEVMDHQHQLKQEEKALRDQRKHEAEAENATILEDIVDNAPSWSEDFHKEHEMPESLPPILSNVLDGTPDEFKDPMLFSLTSALGALCFSRVRANYLDGQLHGPNIQVVIEGPFGAGKGKFEQAYKHLFKNIIEADSRKLQTEERPLIQTVGIGMTRARIYEQLGVNDGLHLYMFEDEISNVIADRKRGNGLDTELLRKAFDGAEAYKDTAKEEVHRGKVKVFLNYTFTGTPNEADKFIAKNVENGTASRIIWSCIPPIEFLPSRLIMPDGLELDTIQQQIETYRRRYALDVDMSGNEHVVNEVIIDLDYLHDALRRWMIDQHIGNRDTARKALTPRAAAIAFQCAIVFHMLYGNRHDTETQQRVIELTLYVANYTIQRFLHKFGNQVRSQQKNDTIKEKVLQTGIDTKAIKASMDNMQGKKWKAMHDSGMSLEEIAQQVGTNRMNVCRKIKRFAKNANS